MKKLIIIAAGLMALAGSVQAERWEIRKGLGDEYELRPKYDYDYNRRYRGTISADGEMDFRNRQTGSRLRGSLDESGYGYLKDRYSGERVFKIRP